VRGRIGLLGHEPLLYRDPHGRENLVYHARLHRLAADVSTSCSTRSGCTGAPRIQCARSAAAWFSA